MVNYAQVVCSNFSYEFSLLYPQAKFVCVYSVAFFLVVLSVLISGNGISNDTAGYLLFNMPLSCCQVDPPEQLCSSLAAFLE